MSSTDEGPIAFMRETIAAGEHWYLAMLKTMARWDQADIQAVVAREQRSLASCLREESRRSPDFAGEIPIEFSIGNDGRVAALWIDEPRFKSGPLHDCLLQALKAWRFKPFPGQQPVVGFTFRIGAP